MRGGRAGPRRGDAQPGRAAGPAHRARPKPAVGTAAAPAVHRRHRGTTAARPLPGRRLRALLHLRAAAQCLGGPRGGGRARPGDRRGAAGRGPGEHKDPGRRGPPGSGPAGTGPAGTNLASTGRRPVLAASGRRPAGAARGAARHRHGPAAAVRRWPRHQSRQRPWPAAIPRVRALPGAGSPPLRSSRWPAAPRLAASPWSTSPSATAPRSSSGTRPPSRRRCSPRRGPRCARSPSPARPPAPGCLSPARARACCVSVLVDDPASEQARAAVADAIESATAAVALRVPFPVDLIFPGEAPPDAIDAWIADNTRPFYHRDDRD